MLALAFETIMDPGKEESAPVSRPESRPVFPRSAGRNPEHELKDRAKAAKLRHRAAKARLKATHLEDRSKHLRTKADQMERRANELDGVSSTPVRSSLND
jgi:acyl-CoA reductase-like NAD-dependent aldehyde dehydrogenase